MLAPVIGVTCVPFHRLQTRMMNQRALLHAGPAAAAAASEGVVPAHFYRSSLDCLYKVGMRQWTQASQRSLSHLLTVRHYQLDAAPSITQLSFYPLIHIINSFIHSFIHSYIHSFIHSFYH